MEPKFINNKTYDVKADIPKADYQTCMLRRKTIREYSFVSTSDCLVHQFTFTNTDAQWEVHLATGHDKLLLRY